MKLPEFKELLATGEGLHVEFKEARDRLPGSFFDTVCAFLNTDGGTIYLGVGDNGAVTGVEPRAVARLKSDIANLSNNPQQLDPPFLLFPHAVTVEGKTVIAVQVAPQLPNSPARRRNHAAQRRWRLPRGINPVNIRKLTKASAQGEDSTRQFEAEAKNADSLASEMAVCLRQRFTVSRWKNCRGAEATNDHE